MGVLDGLTDFGLVESVLDRSPDMIVVADLSGKLLHVNLAGRELTGIGSAAQSVPAATVRDLFGEATDSIALALNGPGRWRGVAVVANRAGRMIPVDVSAFVVSAFDDRPGVVAIAVRPGRDDEMFARWQAAVDASEHRAAEQHAIAELSKLALDGELAELLDASTRAASTLMGVNRSMVTRIADDNPSELVVEAFAGRPPIPIRIGAQTNSLMGYALMVDDVIVCENRDRETRFSTEAMASYGFRSGVCVPIPAGVEPWGALSVHSVENRIYDDSDIAFLQTATGILSAAIRRLELDQKLRRRSTHDTLTGLPNRAFAHQRIDELLAQNPAPGTVAVLILDVDDFKKINDSFGHEAGDLALTHFANRLAGAGRPHDLVARLGGDEFVVVASRLDGAAQAIEIGKSLAESVGSLPTSGVEIGPLRTSIGIALTDADSTRQELLRRADFAMYRAKEVGGGGVAVFDDTDADHAERARRLAVDLRRAVQCHELELFYQPIVQLSSGATVAMEALARWVHPHFGTISPAEFIAVAERGGLISELGEWALETACEQAVEWRRVTDVAIRVNVSALQLRDDAFVSKVAAVLERTGLEPCALGLEITETVWVADTARIAGTLTALHDMGVRMLLDDFGSGHSSISYLRRHRVFECFKIDRSFVADLPDPRAEAIVSALVRLAQAFGVTVVGEGVETEQQLDALRRCGCDLAQGFLLGVPMDATDAMAMLTRTRT